MAKKYVSIEKLGLYDAKIKKVIADGDAASLQSAKDYADSLAKNYDAVGTALTEAGKVQTNLDNEVTRAKAREDEIAGLVSTAQKEVDALELVVDTKAAQSDLTALANKVGEVPADKTVMGMINEINENAYDDTELRGIISDLDAAKADKTQVATDIAAAVKVETDARVEAVTGVQNAVDTLAGTHATDKKALEDAIALKADQTALDEVAGIANAAVAKSVYDVKVKALEDEDVRIAGLVKTEEERAVAAEEALDERLVEVETFFKTAEGETLDTALDTLVEIQKYLDGEGEVADQMLLDIAANKKAIEDHAKVDHDFASADEALKSDLEGQIALKADKTTVEAIDGRVEVAEGKITTLEGKVSTLEGEMDAVESAVAKKAEQSALEEAVSTLNDVDAGLAERIGALEGQLGESGDVATDIATAKQEAIDAASADATQKANTAEANAIAKANELNTAMNSRVEALEAVDHEHANKALLDTYTQTEANLADAVAKKHAHSNLTVLEGVTAEKVAAWDKAEENAKAYADAEFVKDRARLDAVEAWQTDMIECSEAEINALFTA